MDLWIKVAENRILGGSLLKVDNIFIKSETLSDPDAIIWCLFTCKGDYLDSDYIYLGKYKTETRARQILEEIQNLLVSDFLLLKNVSITESGELGKYLEPLKAIVMDDKTDKPQIECLHRDCIVYEMPKE